MTVWSSKSARFTLSNNDLTASGDSVSTHEGVKADTAVSTGVWYWEVTVGSVSGAYVIGTQLTNWAASDSDGGKGIKNTGITYDGQTIAAPVAGTVLGFAVAPSRAKMWVRINGAWAFGLEPDFTGDNDAPVDLYDANQVAYIGLQPGGAVTATANFGATNFAYPKPIGLSQFDVPTGGWQAGPIAQQWVMQSGNPSLLNAMDQWGIEPAEFGQSLPADQWSIEPSAYLPRAVHQSWMKDCPEFLARQLRQQWLLEASITETVWANMPMALRWTFNHYAVGGSALHQRWFCPAAIDWAAYRLRAQWKMTTTAVWTRVITAVTYRMVLTGAPDETTDIELPISNYRSELRADGTSYLQVTVPNGRAYAGEIAARSNGELVISRGIRWTDGDAEVQEIARAALTEIIPYIGGRQSAVTLQARRDPVSFTPKTVVLAGTSYWTRSGNKRRYRLPIDNTLHPGDTAQIEGAEFVVGSIQHTVGPSGGHMEIVEA